MSASDEGKQSLKRIIGFSFIDFQNIVTQYCMIWALITPRQSKV